MGRSHVSKAGGAVEEWDSVVMDITRANATSVNTHGNVEYVSSTNKRNNTVEIGTYDYSWYDSIAQLTLSFRVDGTLNSVVLNNTPDDVKQTEIVSFGGSVEGFFFHFKAVRTAYLGPKYDFTVTGTANGVFTKTRTVTESF